MEVDTLMKQVPPGSITTINEIRVILAKRHNATIACPITTGIFASIAAHAAEEDTAQQKKSITPYWRTLKSTGALNEKYPGGIKKQKVFLESEGLTVVRRGNKYFVQDYENFLFTRD
jgi:hypothetical protein